MCKKGKRPRSSKAPLSRVGLTLDKARFFLQITLQSLSEKADVFLLLAMNSIILYVQINWFLEQITENKLYSPIGETEKC